MNEWDVIVVGGLNSDFVGRGPKLPGPGETQGGDLFFSGPGGKGAMRKSRFWLYSAPMGR